VKFSRIAAGCLAAFVFPLGASEAYQFEVIAGSKLSIQGTERFISPQVIQTIPAPGASSFRLTAPVVLPVIPIGFQQDVHVYQNQQATVVLNTVNGLATFSFRMWLIDPTGHRFEFPVTLTTEIPSTDGCDGVPLCTPTSTEPQCHGMRWDPETSEIKFVQRYRLPCSAVTSIPSEASIDFVIKARILVGDSDGDGIENAVDKCPTVSNASQTDSDADGIGNSCDNCANNYNPLQRNTGGDPNKGDACEPLQINFQPDASVIPAGYSKDAGLTYTPARKYGWLGAATVQTRERNVHADQRYDTFAFTGGLRTWEGIVPAGLYDVQVVSGDPSFACGPHRVTTEGITAINDVSTTANQFVTGNVERRLVGDGRLTVGAGGTAGNTMLDFLIATESQPDTPASSAEVLRPFFSRYVNFQPAATGVPPGYVRDSGDPYSDAAGYGWDVAAPIQSRDRNLGNPVLDTFVYSPANPANWRMALPPDFYVVQLAIGDTQYAQGPAAVSVEGTPWITSEYTNAGETVTAAALVRVLDGFLDVTVGEGAGLTTLNYVTAVAAAPDYDGDGVNNFMDVCPDLVNPGQQDADGNGIGDLCNNFEDSDGDEWADALDNCPATSNPSQADADDNHTGDACNAAEDPDGDEWADVGYDNCPGLANPTQVDDDDDGAGNACDCLPANAAAKALPGEVAGLAAAGKSPTNVTWTSQTELAGSGTVYDVVSEALSGLRAGGGPYGAASCLANNAATPSVSDSRVAPSGDGYLYLVRAWNACGAGTFGPQPARTALNGSAVCP